jgi:hypothetical protein
LDLCGCKHIKDDSVISLTENFPELTYLNLVRSYNFHNFLKTWCISLTDKAIVDGVAKHLKNLNLLSLFGIVTITDASINALIESPNKDKIETLDINGCRDVTNKSED